MSGSGVMKAAIIGMLPDLSSKSAASKGYDVKSTEVQNFGLDRMVALQYWHTWARAIIALLCFILSSMRNPVLSVRSPGCQRWSKIEVRISGGIVSDELRGSVGCWTDEEVDA